MCVCVREREREKERETVCKLEQIIVSFQGVNVSKNVGFLFRWWLAHSRSSSSNLTPILSELNKLGTGVHCVFQAEQHTHA